MRRLRTARIVLLAFVGVLTACGGQRTVPDDRRAVETQNATARNKPLVSEQSSPLRQPESQTRTVVHGDTLYSIAWETGRDYRELATWNRISPPYTIKPGQQLRVISPLVEKTSAAPVPAKSAAKNKVTSKAKRDTQTKIKTAPVKSPDGVKAGTVAGSWAWPADGQLLKRYSDSGSGKGIDIGGTRGQGVRAAAGGRVVYQGSGLRGYGQLIIIKHSDEFLSAYAHNDRIYVKEGDVVKRGQKIADMGNTGTDRVKLHFEIRRQGVPTDPLKHLPKR
jgi:lipoprotein NlpD